jgi:hypothetical protein
MNHEGRYSLTLDWYACILTFFAIDFVLVHVIKRLHELQQGGVERRQVGCGIQQKTGVSQCS